MLELKAINKKGRMGSPYITKHATQEALDAYKSEQIAKGVDCPWGRPSYQKTYPTMDLGVQAGGTFLAEVSTDQGVLFNFSFSDEFVLEETDISDRELFLRIKAIGDGAANFGKEVVSEFRAENIMLGITQKGMTWEVMTKTKDIVYALESGSIYVAKSLLEDFTDFDSEFITQERIDKFLLKINTFLG